MKIKKVLPIIFAGLTVLLSNLSAQSNCYYTPDGYAIGEKYYIYSDVANVRTSPDKDSGISFKLSAGQEVMIISRKKDDYWYFIKTTDGTNREGWIWFETLCFKQLRRGNMKFVFGIDKVIKDKDGYIHNYKYIIKAIDNGKIVDRKSFNVFNNSYIDVNVIENVRLENVKFVIQLEYGGTSCGTGVGNTYFAWLDEKQKLVELPETYSNETGESGFDFFEEILFIPMKNNRNLLIKVTEYRSSDDESKYKHETEFFKWDGEKVTKMKK